MKKDSQLKIISIICMLLLLVCFFIRDASKITTREFLYNSLFNITFIIMTVVIVNFVWNLLGGEPIEQLLTKLNSSVTLLKDSNDSGLMRLISTSGDYGSHKDWMDKLASAKKQVDLMGYTLHVWTRGEQFENKLEELIKNGVQIRIMIMSNNNPDFKSIINTNQISSLDLSTAKGEVDIVSKLITKLANKIKNQGYTGSIKIKTIENGIILNQICSVDSNMTVIPYMYSVNTSESPLLEIRDSESKLFKKYQMEFNRLWELN